MAEEDFDAIVVGAGPAGSACAYTLAKGGKSVLLLERGDSPGAKNVSGGRLYTYALELVEPGLYERAPLERRIVREQIMLLGDQRATTIDYVDYSAHECPSPIPSSGPPWTSGSPGKPRPPAPWSPAASGWTT